MQKNNLSSFERLLVESENELGTSVLIILAWIAACDGKVDISEGQQLSAIAEASNHKLSITPLFEIIKSHDTAALRLACEIVASHFRGEKAHLFLEMAIGMAIADGVLVPSENHILRFLGDLLGVSRSRLSSIFHDVTGKSLPPPSDLSSVEYWQTRNKSKQQSNSSQSKHKRQDRPPPRQAQKSMQAYATLGLHEGAEIVEIRKAYRRLAQVHHPDRFSSLGDESVAAATSTFQRINDAYNYLVRNA